MRPERPKIVSVRRDVLGTIAADDRGMNLRVLVSLTALGAVLLGLTVQHPAALALQMLGVTNCSSSAACIGGANTSNGAGVSASSATGAGVKASSTGAFGTGVIGSSTLGEGIVGSSQSATGIVGFTDATGAKNSFYGVEGIDFSPNSVTFSHNAGVYGLTGHGTGVAAVASQYGTGLYAQSKEGPAITAYNDSQTIPVVEINSGNESNLLQADGSGTRGGTLSVDNEANLQTSGKIYTEGSCAAGCTRRRLVRSYAASEAAPVLEDTGEAEVVAGRADVQLDPAFVNATDPRLGYVVLLTPEGDTRGLFVSARSRTAFSVRELMGGRSTLAFAYRIVAHPFGERSPRLPFDAMRAAPVHDRMSSVLPVSQPGR